MLRSLYGDGWLYYTWLYKAFSTLKGNRVMVNLFFTIAIPVLAIGLVFALGYVLEEVFD